MNPRTIAFLVFTAFSLLALLAGYVARKRNWLSEAASRPIHLHTVIWLWSPICILTLWRIPLDKRNLWLLLLQPLTMAIPAYAMIPLARMLGFNRSHTGVLAISSGLSNNGFTLGAYLCFALLNPAQNALAYAMACVSIMQATMVFIIYPIARAYGHSEQEESLSRLILANFTDIRSVPLYAALTGLALAVFHVPFPEKWFGPGLLTTLFYVGGLGTYMGIGMRLRLGDSKSYFKDYAVLGLMRFAAIPALTALLLLLIRLTPWPLDPLAQQVFQIEAFVPAATMTVIMANLFHLDARMASVTWLWNTILFVVVPLPLLIWYFH